MAGGMDDINRQVLFLTLQEHFDAGRAPVEAAGEVLFLEELMVKDGTITADSAVGNRKIVEAWLAETLGASAENVGAQVARAAEYVSFLRERVPITTSREWIGVSEQAWREWRRTHPDDQQL